MDTQQSPRGEIVAKLARSAERGGLSFPERAFRHAKDPAGSARPAPKPTNGGPRIYDSPEEELEDIGKTLYAPDPWVPRLASDIGEHPRQVRRWANREAKVPPIALHRARLALDRQIARLQALRTRLGMDVADGEA